MNFHLKFDISNVIKTSSENCVTILLLNQFSTFTFHVCNIEQLFFKILYNKIKYSDLPFYFIYIIYFIYIHYLMICTNSDENLSTENVRRIVSNFLIPLFSSPSFQGNLSIPLRNVFKLHKNKQKPSVCVCF